MGEGIGESEMEELVPAWGWRRDKRSWFQKCGEAYRKERSVILGEDGRWPSKSNDEWRASTLTYKVLTTTQPPYRNNLISTQRPRSTRSSSVATLAQPPSSPSLKITDRSFR